MSQLVGYKQFSSSWNIKLYDIVTFLTSFNLKGRCHTKFSTECNILNLWNSCRHKKRLILNKVNDWLGLWHHLHTYVINRYIIKAVMPGRYILLYIKLRMFPAYIGKVCFQPFKGFFKETGFCAKKYKIWVYIYRD